MVDLDAIEKLNDLKNKKVISEQEFLEAKERLIKQPQYGPKSEVAYVLLAFFLGVFGIHNFYAGRWGRGLTQLLITLLTGFVGVVITCPWAIINIFTIRTDKEGRPFEPCPVLRYVFGTVGIIECLWLIGVVVVGGTVGYTFAMNRYRANEIISAAYAVMDKVEEISKSDADDILDKSAMVAIIAMSSNGGQGEEADLSSLGMMELPNCINSEKDIYSAPEGIVTLRISPNCHRVAEEVKEKVGQKLISDTDCDSDDGCVINMVQ